MMRRWTTYPFVTMMLIALMAMGCDRSVFDDLSNCPQGVHFEFYTQTPCQSGPSYPKAIQQLRVFAFDENDILVDEFSAEEVALSGDYRLETLFNQEGNFTFVAWGGEDLSMYDFSDFTVGKTKRNELYVSLRTTGPVIDQHPAPLYNGESETPLSIQNREGMGSIFDLVSLNMREITNRIKFSIYGLPTTESYAVSISANNVMYTIDGDVIDDPAVIYDYIYPVEQIDKALYSYFTVMQLEEGADIRLNITDTKTGMEVFSADLVDELLMYKGQFGPPPYSLTCDHDFNVIIVFAPSSGGTWMTQKVVINDWNVVHRTENLS